MDANAQSQTKPGSYPVGFALSGGGARGFAHLGAIKALEEHEILPDLIAGVSAGSVVGALYCTGYTTEDIMDMFLKEHFKDFADITIPRVSLFNTDGFRDFLSRTLGKRTFRDMQIPLRVIATDLDHGKSTVFKSGVVADAVWASCSIPVIFPPVEINGVNYVDGGVLRNFPVFPIRNECDFIVGVDVNPMKLGDYKKNILSIAERSYNMMFRSNSNEDKKICDLLLEIDDIADYNIFDLKHIKDIVASGYAKSNHTLDKFKAAGRPGLSLDPPPSATQKNG